MGRSISRSARPIRSVSSSASGRPTTSRSTSDAAVSVPRAYEPMTTARCASRRPARWRRRTAGAADRPPHQVAHRLEERRVAAGARALLTVLRGPSRPTFCAAQQTPVAETDAGRDDGAATRSTGPGAVRRPSPDPPRAGTSRSARRRPHRAGTSAPTERAAAPTGPLRVLCPAQQNAGRPEGGRGVEPGFPRHAAVPRSGGRAQPAQAAYPSEPSLMKKVRLKTSLTAPSRQSVVTRLCAPTASAPGDRSRPSV